MHLINEILTLTRLPDEDGYEVWFQHIKTPMMVANRCQFSYLCSITQEDGSVLKISTSRGTEKVAESNAKLVGKGEVLSETKIAVLMF